MPNKLLKTLFFTFLTISLYGQSIFYQGYVIDANGKKQEGYISYNRKAFATPTFFQWKKSLAENEVIVSYDVNNSQEIYIQSDEKKGVIFNAFEIETEVSHITKKDKFQKYTTQSTPTLQKNKIFLQPLVKGQKANLWTYTDNDLRPHFIAEKNKTLSELIYVVYLISNDPNASLAYNRKYRSQITEIMTDAPNLMVDIKKLSYSEKEIIAIFEKYNNYREKTAAELAAETADVTKYGFGISVGVVAIQFIPNEDQRKVPIQFSPTIGVSYDILLAKTKERLSLSNQLYYQYMRYSADYSTQLDATQGSGTQRNQDTLSYDKINYHLATRYILGNNKKTQPFLEAALVMNVLLRQQYTTFETYSNSNTQQHYDLYIKRLPLYKINRPEFGFHLAGGMNINQRSKAMIRYEFNPTFNYTSTNHKFSLLYNYRF